MKLRVESHVFMTYQHVTKIEEIGRHEKHDRPSESGRRNPMSQEEPRNLT